MSKELYYRNLLESFQSLNEHHCPDWDGLEITVHDVEFEACTCNQYKSSSYSPIRENLLRKLYDEPPYKEKTIKE